MTITTTPGDRFIGIMSGTSLDAVDVAICGFDPKVETIAFHSYPFAPALRDILYELATARRTEIDDLARTHFLLASVYADAVRSSLEAEHLTNADIRAIGLHGQTIRHLPDPVPMIDGIAPARATIQLGSGSALAALSGIDVVSDFRSADVAIGGQGAPLVPMFDAVFLRDEKTDRAALNIGGIANVTILPSRASGRRVEAFDTGPGNMLMDELARRYFSKPFDEDGKIAASGSVSEEFITSMLLHSYFSKTGPKSTGRELFGGHFLAEFTTLIDGGRLSATDALSTAAELTARSIAHTLTAMSGELIVSGGGAGNIYLLSRLAALLPNCTVVTSDKYGISAHAKEAIAFAYFAKAYLDETPIHLPTTTGASRQLILGTLARG